MSAAGGVLVTHADSSLGSAVARALLAAPEERPLVLLASGPRPRRLTQAIAQAPGRRVTWLQARLDRHRSAGDAFRCAAAREAAPEAVVYVPMHGSEGARRTGPARVPSRTAEARVVTALCRETPSVRRLVAIGSAFVYRLEPGNANRLHERQALDFEGNVPTELRSWIDCDVLLRQEAEETGLALTLLRVPAVLAADGRVHGHPALETGRARPLGFDPLCAVVTEEDVARAVLAALRAEASGIFNVAGPDCVPLSVLRRWTGCSAAPLPGALLRAAGATLRRVGAREVAASLDPAYQRFGFTLDTRRAEHELGFRARSRVALGRAGEGVLRIEHGASTPG